MLLDCQLDIGYTGTQLGCSKVNGAAGAGDGGGGAGGGGDGDSDGGGGSDGVDDDDGWTSCTRTLSTASR